MLSEPMGLSTVEDGPSTCSSVTAMMTAGEPTARTGLAPASVTGVIDRLARKGFVRRAAHHADRGRVNVELDPEHVETFARLMEDVVSRFGQLLRRVRDNELELTLGHLRRSVRILAEATAELAGAGASG